MSAPIVPWSYLVRESQRALLPDLAFLLQTCGAPITDKTTSDPRVLWARDKQKWGWKINNPSVPDHPFLASVEWTNVGMDGSSGEWINGTISPVRHPDRQTVPQEAQTFDNSDGNSPLNISQTHTVTLNQTRSTTLKTGIKVDIKADQKLTIDDKAQGVSLEASLEEAFGWSTDTTTAEAQTDTKTETVQISTSIPPGHSTLAQLVYDDTETMQPFTARGPWTGGLTIRIPANPTANGDPGQPFTPIWRAFAATAKREQNDYSDHQDIGDDFVLKFETLEAAIETLSGVNVDNPHFTIDGTSGIDWLVNKLFKPETRWINVEGTAHRNYPNNIHYKYSDVKA